MLSVYRASAGSGKTFTLAKDYIKLLISVKRKDSDDDRRSTYHLNLDRAALPERRMLAPFRHRSILAITFTHKATEEMKTRILNELRTLADPGAKSDYEQDFAKELGCSRQEMAIAADMALRQILYDYHNFNVSTIDSFFQRVLHTFARELDHQSDYNVELSETSAMAQAVGAMLDDFNSAHYSRSPELEAWLYGFLCDSIDKGTKANFFNRNSKAHSTLVQLMSKIGLESFKDYKEQMRAYLADPALAGDFTGELREKIIGIPALVKNELEPLISNEETSHLSKRTSLQWILDQALEGKKLSEKSVKSLYTDTANKVADGTAVFTNKYGTDEQKANMARAIAIVRERYFQMATMRKLLDCMPMLGLLAHAWRYLEELAKETNTLLISDTNELVSRIIGHDDTPFIYERMGCRLSHFLIDEFQDTSRLQWENLQPLVANGLSAGDDSLVIGDEKQSIYRFRNSDSSILHSQVEQQLGQYIDPDAEAARKNVNWRSSERVVRFNNTLFSIINDQKRIDGYDGVAQQVSPKHRGPRGYVRFIETQRGEGKNDKKKTDEPMLRSGSDEVLHMMAAEILRQRHQGGYRWKDIAVLVNTGKEARRVVQFLIDNYFGKIKVLSDEALKLASSPAVQLIISTMKIIDTESSTPKAPDGARMSQSQIALAVSRYEYCLNAADAAADSDPARYTRALKQALDPAMQSVATELLGPGADMPSSILALAELIATRRFTDDERRRHFAYLAAFHDVIIDFSTRCGGSLHEFLQWWDANSASFNITGAAEADAVKIMTVHKSKGLEFECVHIPFCTWPLHWQPNRPPQVWIPTPSLSHLGLAKTPPPALFVTITSSDSDPRGLFYDAYSSERDKSLADTINKTYVAFTRAKSELIAWYNSYANTIGSAIADAFKAGAPSDFDPDTMMDLAPCMLTSEKLDGDIRPLSELVIGEPTACIPDPDKDKPASMGEPVEAVYPASTSKKTRAALSVASVLGNDSDSIVEDNPADGPDSEAKADEPDEQSRIEGIILHDIMAQTRRRADLPRAAERVARMRRLPADLATRLAAIARKALEIDPALSRLWFDDFAKVRVEQPIYVPSLDIVRRPDRVVTLPDGSTHVIDYKFTDRPERLGAESHITQVRQYMGLMSDSGCTRVSGFLVYPRLGKILPVK